MKGNRVKNFAVACSLILASGAVAQNETMPLPTTVVEESVPGVYRNQANVAQSKMLYEQELAKAAREARIDKALKAKMAAQGMSARPSLINAAAQFSRANGPSSDRSGPRRGDDYQSPFESPSDPTDSSAPVRPETGTIAENAMTQTTEEDFEQAKQKGNFFSKLFGKIKADTPPDPGMPSEYEPGEQVESMPPETAAAEASSENSFESPSDAVGPETGTIAENAVIQTTEGGGEIPKPKGNFFSNLFGERKADTPPDPGMPSEYESGEQVESMPLEIAAVEVPSENSSGIPSVSVRPEAGTNDENATIQMAEEDFELPKRKGDFFSQLFAKRKADISPDLGMPSEYEPGEQVELMPLDPAAAEAPSENPFEIPDPPEMNEAM